MSALTIAETDLPFPLSRSGFKYLGINVTRTLSGLYDKNYIPLINNLKINLQKWRVLNLSLAGKIACVKMNIFPRFLYVFQSIPVFLSISFLRSVDRLISSFLWGNKHPMVRKVLLQRNRAEGGLTLPNLMYYYWAANLQKIVYWIQVPNADWCQSEANTCMSSSLPALVTAKLPLSPKQYSSCPIVTYTLRIWSQFRQNFNLTDLSFYGPICNNHIFLPAKSDTVFAQWQRAGLDTFGDLYIDGTFATFNALSIKFNLQHSSLFRYFQVRHFVQSISPSFPSLPPRTGLDVIFYKFLHILRVLSQIFIILSCHSIM